MEMLSITFPVSGVTTNVLFPPLVAFVIAFFSSTGGLSGAFMILPFQVSVLGFAGPGASATNFLFNVVAIPGGVYRYIREGRLYMPLALILTVGTFPGVVLGYYLRIRYLPDPTRFRLFAGLVLLFIGSKLVRELLSSRARGAKGGSSQMSDPAGIRPETLRLSLTDIRLRFVDTEYSFNPVPLFLLSLVVGVAGGAYGIGGGAVLAPFCISVLGLPVYITAGATLLSTFLTSVVGVLVYTVVDLGVPSGPDWSLGVLFGLGGLAGTYLGARMQRHLPQRTIKIILAVLILSVSLKYILGAVM